MPFFLLLLLPLTATNSQHHKFSIGDPEFCDQTSECLAKVRRMAQESNRFWFGDQWRFNCAAGQHQQGRGGGDGRRSRAGTGDGGAASALDCLNPPELAPFASLGSRLFRVHTFTPAYLANLRVFPRMHFQPRSGFYRACAHNYEVVVSEEERLFGLAGHPLAQPVPAFQAQQTPDLSWPELHANHSSLILMLDVGGGRLSYMAIDFPRDTKVLAEFLPLDNFRLMQPTPLAVLIFELPKAKTIRQSLLEAIEAKWTTPKAARRENFDLSQFMVEHRLEKGLIGLNWVLIDADPFAIEKQRLQGMPDNCHALVLQKLHQDRRWHFVQTFPLSAELDSSLSVSLAQPKLNVQVCCKSQSIEQEQLFLDPLGDLQVPTAALRQGPPTVTSLRPMESGGEAAAYQRASRHYIVFRDERYSLLLVDPERRYLHWLIVDIPAEGLASGNFDEAAVVANYLAPVPQLPSAHCHFPVFMLFRQPRAEPMAEFFGRDHPLRQNQCQQGHCANRANFNVEQFKALHRLQLSALNWAKVCFDLFEASHQISSLRQRSSELVHQGNGNDGRAKAGSKRSGGRAVSYLQTTDRAERDRQIGAICAQFPDHNQTEHRQCIVQTSAGASSMIRLGTNFAGFCCFLTALLLSILGSSSRRTLINGGCCWLL